MERESRGPLCLLALRGTETGPASADAFVEELIGIAGRRHVHTDPRRTEWYRAGFRSGEGEAEGVVLAGTLLELWRALKSCVENDRIVIMQAANAGLAEGSAPNGSYRYARPRSFSVMPRR